MLTNKDMMKDSKRLFGKYWREIVEATTHYHMTPIDLADVQTMVLQGNFSLNNSDYAEMRKYIGSQRLHSASNSRMAENVCSAPSAVAAQLEKRGTWLSQANCVCWAKVSARVQAMKDFSPYEIALILSAHLGVQVCGHESDLHVKASFINEYGVNKFVYSELWEMLNLDDLKNMSTFQSDVDGSEWVEIPFGRPRSENERARVKKELIERINFLCGGAKDLKIC